MLQIKTCDNKICNKMSNSNYTNYVMSFKTCQLSGADRTVNVVNKDRGVSCLTLFENGTTAEKSRA